MKFIAARNIRYTHRRKLYRVSDVLEDGYNELINVAINLTQYAQRKNAKHIKLTLVCLLVGCVVFQPRNAN